MAAHSTFKVRCRAIILAKGKLLVVRHTPDADFVALPGGHLKSGEGIEECMKREIIEELGIEPHLGRLLYVNNFTDREGVQSVEFFFEVLNGEDYLELGKAHRTHAHELVEILWMDAASDVNLMPEAVAGDFKEDRLLSDKLRFVKSHL